MDGFFACAGIALVSALLALGIKKSAPQMAALTAIAGGVLILVTVVGNISAVAEQFKRIGDISLLSSDNFVILFKVLGVSVTSGIIAEVCRDCGAGALAAKTELAGSVISVLLTLPLMAYVLETVSKIIE